jgi:hypothetical protein
MTTLVVEGVKSDSGRLTFDLTRNWPTKNRLAMFLKSFIEFHHPSVKFRNDRNFMRTAVLLE